MIVNSFLHIALDFLGRRFRRHGGRSPTILVRAAAYALIVLLILSPQTAWVGEGRNPIEPFPFRNQGVPALLFLPFEPASAHTLQSGEFRFRLDFSYSSLFSVEGTQENLVDFDMELLEVGLGLDYGVTSRLQLGVHAPFRHYYGGFLDGFIESFHDVFGFPNAGREKTGRNLVRMVWIHEGDVIYERTGAGSGFGDLSVFGRYVVFREGTYRPGISLAGQLRVPTGDRSSFLSSRTLGGSGGIVIEKHVYPLAFNLNACYRVQESPAFLKDLRVRNGIAGSFTAAYLLTERLTPMVQLNGAEPLFKGTGLKTLDRGLLQLIVGFSYQCTQAAKLHVGFAEDLISASSPDFTLHLSMSHTF